MTSSIRYEDLGLVNTREMFTKAMQEKYAIPAYNFNNMEQLQAIITGCVQSNSPVILQVSGGARKYADPVFLPHMVKGAVAMARGMGSSIPIALHLDHGSTFELAKDCIDSGFSSVMQAIIYIKKKEDLEVCRDLLAQNGFPQNRALFLVDTDVCRDELLFEIELIASGKRMS